MSRIVRIVRPGPSRVIHVASQPALQPRELSRAPAYSDATRLGLRPIAPRDAVNLQRAIGNRAVARLLAPSAEARPVEPSVRAKPDSIKIRHTSSKTRLQRLPVSNNGMKNCGFKRLRSGSKEWIWLNKEGSQPNHVSAIRDGDKVGHIHAKTQFPGNKTNRIDWDESAAGEFEGPVENRKQAPEQWATWYPDAKSAGEETIRLLKANKKDVT